jgi:hypothetical protein
LRSQRDTIQMLTSQRNWSETNIAIWVTISGAVRLGEVLISNQAFWSGSVIGALFVSMSFICAFGLVKTFRMSWGIEAAVYELAARRGHENFR